jgi:Uma2 family endonuclease
VVQTPVRSLTFEEFLEACPADGKRYELIDGQIVELIATREHDDIAEFLQLAMQAEKDRLKLNYRVTTKATVKTLAVAIAPHRFTPTGVGTTAG